LKKRGRGIRTLERAAESNDDVEAEIVRGYCVAVRSALTDDGRPPLAAAGLKLQERLTAIAASLDRVAAQIGVLPGGLPKLRSLLQRGLEETATLWPPVRAAYRWVKRVARLLDNQAGLPAAGVRRRLGRLLGQIRQAAATASAPVRGQLQHFVKVTQSYRAGLFWCYQSTDLPRTNNDLEHLFGSHKYHERRASGRRRAAPGLVVSGAARIVAGLATRLRPQASLELPADYVAEWRRIRAELERRREARRQQGRFRRDPVKYLNRLEVLLIQLSLLS
jgi:cob(I)alamin adenosyltransferase